MAERASAPPAEIGAVIGSYRLDALVGRGGMSYVYRASHLRLGRVAAVKVLSSALAENARYVARFFREARIVNDIRHPNIIDIIDFIEQETPRRVAYVMEMLHGEPLSATIARRQIGSVQAVHVGRQLVGALAAAHAAGVIHRDLKPDNVFVVASASPLPSIKVLDFGVAKLTEPTDDPHISDERAIVGTPAYMAPEQITGEAVTPATDVYALGAILFEMLSGERAYPSAAPTDLFRHKLNLVPADVTLPPDMPDAARVRALVLRCLSIDPRVRPTLGEVSVVLEDVAHQIPVLAEPMALAFATGELTGSVRREAAMLQSQSAEEWVELSSPTLTPPARARERRGVWRVSAAIAALVVLMVLMVVTLVVSRRGVYRDVDEDVAPPVARAGGGGREVSAGAPAVPAPAGPASAALPGGPAPASAVLASASPAPASAAPASTAPTPGASAAAPASAAPAPAATAPAAAAPAAPASPSSSAPASPSSSARPRPSRPARKPSDAEILHKDEMPQW